jgi:hypothetical protein
MKTAVPFSLERLRLIAGNTFLEAVRQRLFLFLLLVAVGLVGSVQFFRDFNFGASELKFIADFGMGALVFFGSILAITATAQLFFSEIENRTALTLLAKPVWRLEFIAGKFAGVWGVVGLFCAVTTAVLIGLLWWRETGLMAEHPEAFELGRHVNYGAVVVAAALQWLKFGVLVMITLLVASFSNTNLFTVVVSFFVLVICHLQYLARESLGHDAGFALKAGVTMLAGLFPNFQMFNVAEMIGVLGGDDGLSWVTLAQITAYGAGYLAVFGGLAVYSFRHREI